MVINIDYNTNGERSRASLARLRQSMDRLWASHTLQGLTTTYTTLAASAGKAAVIDGYNPACI